MSNGMLKMMHWVVAVAAGGVLCGGWPAVAADAGPGEGGGAEETASGFPDAHDEPPADWMGPVFELSQDYPPELPAAEVYPWDDIDFKTDPRKYLEAVLEYVCEGNTEVDWRVQDNAVRKWYHAPWMHFGNSGREFIHGLTRERTSRAGELAPTQTDRFQNWAVGFTNPPGGYVLGRVWHDPEAPDASQSKFPLGTVSAKLLFTEATVEQVPFLEGAKVWQAHIHKTLTSNEREIRELRLLQIDVAVRDSRADDTTGWVFGTFIYQEDAPGDTPLDRMVPVGLMWGNDPGVTPQMVDDGTDLHQTWLNPELALQQYGWAGRLNGPVDNPVSSCLSCHSTAQIPSSSPMVPRNNMTLEEKLRWFRNLPAGEPFDAASTSTDYSLQVSMGIFNFLRSQEFDVPVENLAAEADVESAGRLKRAVEGPMEIKGQVFYPVDRGD